MSKVFIRTLYQQDYLWKDSNEMEDVRKVLNELGFYVLHSKEDSLDVYAIQSDWWNI